MDKQLTSPGRDWDEAYDVVIVGSGAAGLTAAIIAARRGLSAIVVEKAEVWGGTSALAVGGIWVPANRLMAEAGLQDSKEDAIRFLDAVVPPSGLGASAERRSAYVENAARMMDELIEAGMQWDIDKDHPDYDSEEPFARVGRCLDSRVFNGKRLGPWLKTMRPSTLSPIAVQLADLSRIGRGDTGRLIKVGLRHVGRRMLGQQPLGAGASLVAQLMTILQSHKVPVRLGTSLEEVVVEGGRAQGVVVRSGDGTRRIGAHAGVVLCAGGFAHDDAMRQRLHGMSGAYSGASADDTGDVIKLADGLGAMTEFTADAWWASAFVMPDGSPAVSHVERAVPFGFCVGRDGKRFVNESRDYYHFARAMVERGGEPIWLIIDSRHRKRYPFLGNLPGKTPKWMLESGMLKTADSLAELARICGIDETNLQATAERFNAFARQGVDEDFRRGEAPYDRHWGDPRQKPNPSLGPVEQPPFYATQIHIGDLGTKGGYVTDANGQVLDTKGKPMEALYASGNVTAAVMGDSYPGPGITLGPAMTFALLAVEHAAARRTNR